MSGGLPPWVEGEKIPDEHLRDIFRPPPGVAAQFYRSALIIGSRGVGKTTLLRYHKLTHSGVAIHLSLAAELACLTKQTAFGPLAFDIPATLQPLLTSKTISVFALALTERLMRRNISVQLETLALCLPTQFRPRTAPITLDWIAETKRSVAAATLEAFSSITESIRLAEFVSAAGHAAQRSHGPLLLLLDRGDMVPAPSLVPVLDLLDQSSSFIALLAMRPGHAGQALGAVASGVVAGDHYQVVHLGISPRSPEWPAFVEAAISAQLGDELKKVPRDSAEWVIAISRDSLKTALELFARYLAVAPDESEQELTQAISDAKENHLTAAQRLLQMYHPDFRDLVNRIRAAAVARSGGHIDGPLVLAINQPQPGFFFEPPSRTTRFLDLAIRAGAFCMPEGFRWIPGAMPAELELPPIIVWRKDDPRWRCDLATSIRVDIAQEQLLKQLGGPGKPPTIFVAYRMNFSESKKFRHDFQLGIQSHPDLGTARIIDGHVYAGDKWAETIRDRIKSAKIVVGDVTGMRSDVLFELGFAYGLKKRAIPVVSAPADGTALPRWLNATQLGFFGTPDGQVGIIASVAKYLSDPDYFKVTRPPQPIPSLIVWYRRFDWNSHAFDQFSTITNRSGLKAELLTLASEDSIRRAASASLLVVSLDGTEDDAAVHYICGAVAAKPTAGTGKGLARRVIVLEEPHSDQSSFVADSLHRCEDTVAVVATDEIRVRTEQFLTEYRIWAGVM